ncbi:MAG: zinc transporter ZupT [Lentimicrobiaceae bacterium]|nr:zinc transporter ZupT [Lentimicrobiaceae bacterium]
MNNQVLIAFSLTLFAGLSTGIGSAIAFFAKRTNTLFLSVSLGFSAGVMIYISFVELLSDAISTLSALHGESNGTLYAVLAFFGGILLIMIIDALVPKEENPHEFRGVEEIANVAQSQSATKRKNTKLMRVGLLTALVLAIHNFPEGMVTFLAALKDVKIAVPIAVAIAIHNIPEGIAVSVPIYYATGNRKRAFWLSFLSGLAEPLGALVGYLILAPFLNDNLFGIMFAVIAGIMVFISLDELLPAAEKCGGKHHHAIYGLVAGMAVMAIGLLLLG